MEINNEEKLPLASVSYSIFEDASDIIIDLSFSDYDSVSGDAMCSIIEMLSREGAVITTVNMLREGLYAAGEQELFIDMLTKIGVELAKKTKNKDKYEDKREESKPCILPSDML